MYDASLVAHNNFVSKFNMLSPLSSKADFTPLVSLTHPCKSLSIL